jgi:hypothetical protein
VVSPNSYVLSKSTLISISSLLSMAALRSRIFLLVEFVLPYGFLIMWTKVKVRFVLLAVIPSLKVITFSFLLVGSTTVSFDEKLSYKVPCVFFFSQLFYLSC